MGALDPLPGCDCSGTATEARCDGTLPDSPDCAIKYHFGMLLGVDDFRTEQGFHLGHHRRHQRWLHGSGVVWGMKVYLKNDELHVTPGYAIDQHGRDVYVDVEQCLNLPAWWDKHKKDDFFSGRNDEAPPPVFDADIVLCARTCLSRPVPAIADPCGQSTTEIAYSRICESFELMLVPKQPGDDEDRTDASSQSLFRLLARANDPVADKDGSVVPHPDGLTEPLDGDDEQRDCLVIAHVRGITIAQEQARWLAAVAGIDFENRPTLLPTSVLQELVRALISRAGSPGAAGPMLVDDRTVRADQVVTLVFDKPLAKSSVAPEAFVVSEFLDASGWDAVKIDDADYDDATRTVTLTLKDAPSPGALVRLAVRGSGPAPLLGVDLTPFQAPTTASDGVDRFITI
jgi:hypothetical protein